MKRTISPDAMYALERTFMDNNNVPGALLMEHAAQGVCAAILRYVRQDSTVLFLCGPGNNGGDGYASARLWQSAGGKSMIIELPGAPYGDAAMNRRLAQQAGVLFLPLAQADTALRLCDAIVDALFGIGLSREPDETASKLILAVNRSGKPVISVDIPSGLFAQDGCVFMVCPPDENNPDAECTPEAYVPLAVKATETVTFHRIKDGLLLNDGPNHTGKLTVHPILIPDDDADDGGMDVLMPQEVRSLIEPRPANAHKGSMGKVVIFAGSWGMTGAAALCARAAIKTGAGLTYVLCRQAILPMLQILCPGAVCIPLPEQDGVLTPDCADLVRNHLANADSAVVGCGISRDSALLPLLIEFRNAQCPVVWDADALYLLHKHRDTLLPLPWNAVITPHPGEAARLLDTSAEAVAHTVQDSLARLYRMTGSHVLLKAPRTLMTNGSSTAVNPIGTPALSRGGSGDILSGMLGALLAQQDRINTQQLGIMQLAALLHVMAAQRAEAQYGEDCVTPESIIDNIRLD